MAIFAPILLSTLALCVTVSPCTKPAPAYQAVEHSGTTMVMEKINFQHSLKNIPVPSRKTYLQMLINSFKTFNRNWKAFFFLNPASKTVSRETFGFKSIAKAPPCP